MVSFVKSIGLMERASPMAAVNSIKAGLPLETLEQLARAIAPGDAAFAHRFVPRSTLTRRKAATKPKLTVDEGSRVAAVAKVWDVSLEIYRDEAKAREFLYRAHPLLEGARPVDVATETSLGADLVVQLLGAAAYGGPV